MRPEVWTAGASLVGVVVGGTTSFLAQAWLWRRSERAEARRRDCELSEARRAERLAHLTGFLEAAQEAERIAVDRYHHGQDDERWHARMREIEDRFWVLQKTIHLLCPEAVNDAARDLAFALQKVLRDGPGDPDPPQDEKVWAHIRPSRRRFLDVAAGALASERVR